ncbi:MAG: c-type cytochrome [Pseudomonadota bacterium]
MKNATLLSLLIVVALTACGKKAEAPVPVVVVPAPAAAPAMKAASAEVLAVGEKVYTATCAACHAAAVMGAPKIGDKTAWAPRMSKGAAALYTSASDGLKLMPARGGNPALKDEELKAAVDFMVSKAL